MAKKPRESDVSSNKFLVIGLGKTGYSCVDYLVDAGCEVHVWDTREHPPYLVQCQNRHPDVEITLGPLDANRMQAYDTLLVSPGIALQQPSLLSLAHQGKSIIGDIEVFARAAKAPIIAITGSNGKSTVTEWVGDVLTRLGKKILVGGNLGTPALDLLKHPTPDYFVLELSSFQLETTETLNAHVACVLNVTADHLDRYQNLDDYAKAKQRIFLGSQYQVFNRLDARTFPAQSTETKPIHFGTDAPLPDEPYGLGLTQHQGETWITQQDRRLCTQARLSLKGAHNLENAMAVLAIVQALGFKSEDILPLLAAYKGLQHRCQFVGEYQGVTWINDSKGTNIGATKAALRGFGNPFKPSIIWIAGGQGKGADFNELRAEVGQYVKRAIFIGQDALRMHKALQEYTQTELAPSLERAVIIAKEAAESHDVVLLSPACASLDMFDNFEARGVAFCKCVQSAHSVKAGDMS